MLPETQKILHKFYSFHHHNIKACIPDFKPKWNSLIDDESTSYGTFEEMNVIYEFIYGLFVNVNGDLFTGNYDHCFLHSKHAISEINDLNQYVKGNLEILKQLQEKHEAIAKEKSRLPPASIFITLDFYTKASETFDYILESDEVALALAPGIVEKLKDENQKLVFKSYWNSHLILLVLKFVLYVLLVITPTLVVIKLGSTYVWSFMITLIVPILDSYFSKERVIDLIKITISSKYRKTYRDKFYSQIYK